MKTESVENEDEESTKLTLKTMKNNKDWTRTKGTTKQGKQQERRKGHRGEMSTENCVMALSNDMSNGRGEGRMAAGAGAESK